MQGVTPTLRVHPWHWLLIGAAATLGSVGCSVPKAVTSSATTTAPPDRDGAIGAPFEIDGIETVVLGVEAYDQSSLGFPRLRVLVRTENMSGRASDNPEVELRCDEPSAPSDWYAGTSWQPGGAIGAAEVRQGEVIVGFPHKPAITARQYPLATCTSPILRFTPGGPAVLGTTEASKGASAGGHRRPIEVRSPCRSIHRSSPRRSTGPGAPTRSTNRRADPQRHLRRSASASHRSAVARTRAGLFEFDRWPQPQTRTCIGHGSSRSAASPTSSTSASSWWRPSTCNPTGSPPTVPAGIDAAGLP